MFKKRIALLLLSFIMLTALSGCGQDTDLQQSDNFSALTEIRTQPEEISAIEEKYPNTDLSEAEICIPMYEKTELNLYINGLGGGPTHLTEDFEIIKNTGNSYYAECTYITDGNLSIIGTNNTPSQNLYFTSAKRINFISTTYHDILTFTAKWSPRSSTTTGRANAVVGSTIFINKK